ncbi:MAG: diacylglycerol kinase family protein [Aerococcaceae bacterium]|nr:diacylglycerol kinase family protein [Aerococcaceae bacterium]
MGLHANASFWQAVKHAVNGIWHTLRNERNLKIHALATVAVMIAGVVYRITTLEWAIILLCVGGVWAAELLNTAIEAAVDLAIGDTLHPLAKIAKDAAAGAVLVLSLVASIVGMLIFVPYILR